MADSLSSTKDSSLDSKIDAILDRFWSGTPIGELGKCRERAVQHILDIILSERSEADILGRISEHTMLSEVTKMSINSRSGAITTASFMLNVNDFQKYRLKQLELGLTQQSNGGK